MIRKHLVMSVMIAMVLLVVAFIPFSNQAGTYDPWYDVNGDGKMDGRDIAYTAAGFGTTGDPARNVTISHDYYYEYDYVYLEGEEYAYWSKDADTGDIPAFKEISVQMYSNGTAEVSLRLQTLVARFDLQPYIEVYKRYEWASSRFSLVVTNIGVEPIYVEMNLYLST